MTLDVLSVAGETKGTVELPEVIFGQKPRKDVLWEAVNCFLANQRQGTAKTKTRAEVSGGGKKPWRQKHTGRARHGSTRSPIWKHGGIVFGPHPRDYSLKIPVTKRRLALHVALSVGQSENRVKVVEDFELPTSKTKELAQVLKSVGLKTETALLVVEKPSDNLKLAARNMAKLDLMRVQDLNAYEVLNHDQLLFTRSAIAALGKVQ